MTPDRAMRLRQARTNKNRHNALRAVITVIAIIAVIQVMSYITSTRALNDQVRASNQQLINTYGGK